MVGPRCPAGAAPHTHVPKKSTREPRGHDLVMKEEVLKSFDTFKDLQVTLDKDRPGALAKATTAIANAGINIEGFCEVDGQFHTVTSDPSGAQKALDSAVYKVRETDGVVLPAEERPGFLADRLTRVRH